MQRNRVVLTVWQEERSDARNVEDGGWMNVADRGLTDLNHRRGVFPIYQQQNILLSAGS